MIMMAIRSEDRKRSERMMQDDESRTCIRKEVTNER
jgi:hypothetical protein